MIDPLALLYGHVAATIACLGYGAYYWLGDEDYARRHEVGREMDYGVFGLPDLEAEREGQEVLRERNEKAARRAGKLLVGVGAILALALPVHLFF